MFTSRPKRIRAELSGTQQLHAGLSRPRARVAFPETSWLFATPLPFCFLPPLLSSCPPPPKPQKPPSPARSPTPKARLCRGYASACSLAITPHSPPPQASSPFSPCPPDSTRCRPPTPVSPMPHVPSPSPAASPRRSTFHSRSPLPTNASRCTLPARAENWKPSTAPSTPITSSTSSLPTSSPACPTPTSPTLSAAFRM